MNNGTNRKDQSEDQTLTKLPDDVGESIPLELVGSKFCHMGDADAICSATVGM